MLKSFSGEDIKYRHALYYHCDLKGPLVPIPRSE